MGERLTVLRERLGATQEAAAEAVGLERASLSAIEGGEVVSRATLRALADFYRVTVDYLERGTPLPGKGGPGHDAEHDGERDLLTAWRELDEHQRRLIVGIIGQMLKE
jgi:transcriptional regulator with XRE-family HTH domain